MKQLVSGGRAPPVFGKDDEAEGTARSLTSGKTRKIKAS